MATIWDVAARAGVSKSTVSLVLNRSPLVKEETRQRVMAAIKALDYVPNYNARSLIRRRSNSIGLIHIARNHRERKMHYETDYGMEQFFAGIEDGIFSAIIEQHEDMSIIKEHLELRTQHWIAPQILKERRVDGLIIVGGFDNSEVIEQLRQIEVPTVIVTSPGIEGIDCVLHDPYTAYQLAMRKLVETGHKRICSFNCPKYYRTWMLRAKSLQDSEKELNISLDPDMQISPDNMTPHSVYELFSALIDSGKKPDAVIALSDDYTMSVLRCLYERGLRVPDDISIISAEDSNICGNLSPAITAVNIQKEAIGNKALNFLLDRINHPELPAREITVTPYLVMRDSVANRK